VFKQDHQSIIHGLLPFLGGQPVGQGSQTQSPGRSVSKRAVTIEKKITCEVRVSIQESGDYDFASYRTIGVFGGKGNFTVKDGKATAHGENGSVTVQLFTDKASGKSMLKAEGKGKDGISYRAELTKAGDALGKRQ